MRKRLNILLPGGFKPVHGGHIMLMRRLMDKYSREYEVHLYVIMSYSPREGYYPQSSKIILDRAFENDPRFNVIICDGSPVRRAYSITATQEFGNCYYGMAASNKNYDAEKCDAFYNNFQPGGRYYNPDVKVIRIEDPDRVEIYRTRGDENDGLPVSSSLMRRDIEHKNFEWFVTNFETALKVGMVTMDDLYDYYNELLDATVFPMSEGGVGGHISHPYENGLMTFGEIRETLEDLFDGKITDISEKIDGINIYASVDNKGNTIFARNLTQLRETPLSMSDIKKNQAWNEVTREAFVNGAETIEAVFGNLDDKVSFFNYDDKADSVVYRTWAGFEIVDIKNPNVIPYVESYISFNDSLKTVCVDYNVDVDPSKRIEIFDSPNFDRQIPALKDAMKKTNDTKFKVSQRPPIIVSGNAALLEKYSLELDDIMDEYGLSDESTINDYKESAVSRILFNKSELTWVDSNTIAGLAKKIVDPRFDLKPYKYEKTKINKYYGKRKEILKVAMAPLEQFFVNLGNDVIKASENLINKGNEAKVISSIRKQISGVIDRVEKSGDINQINKLEELIKKLGDAVNINASEGVVFRRKGVTYKLTGSFSVLNQIMHLK